MQHSITAAGYVYIGMDHFALPDDDLALAQARGDLHRNFMGYTTHADSDLRRHRRERDQPHRRELQPESPRPADLAGRDRRRPLAGVSRHALERGRPVARRPDPAADVPGRAAGFTLERRYAIDFRDYFRDALVRLQPMVDDGLVRLEEGRILATSRGRLLLRNIAMCFDRYLDRPGIPLNFSRAI